MWGYHNGMGWWMVMGGIWTILFWAVIIGLVVWGVRAATGKSHPLLRYYQMRDP